MKKFTPWLRKQTHRDDPIGELARDVTADTNWPDSFGLLRLHRYLQKQHACEGARRSLTHAWAEWKYGI